MKRSRLYIFILISLALALFFLPLLTALAAVIATYASANQDVDVQLNGQSGAGGTTTITGNTATNPIGAAGGLNYGYGQGFQVSAGTLSQFTFYFGANTGSPTGTITWEIRDSSGGNPGSTVLKSGTFTPTASATNTITVTAGPFLTASTTYYALMRSTNTQSAGNSWNVGESSTNVYAPSGVTVSTDGGANWGSPSATYDAQASFTTSALTALSKLAQSFQIGSNATIHAATLYLKKVGSPTGTMTLRIETDSSGSPSGTLLNANATITVAESGLTTSYASTTFDFYPDFAATASTSYWLVLSTDRAASNTNYVLWGADASSPGYADGLMKSYTGSWAAETKDAIFEVLDDVGVATPTNTNTPTNTLTPGGPTFTPSNTPTPTVDLWRYATLSSGQPTGLVFSVTLGDIGIFATNTVIVVLLLFIAFLLARRGR